MPKNITGVWFSVGNVVSYVGGVVSYVVYGVLRSTSYTRSDEADHPPVSSVVVLVDFVCSAKPVAAGHVSNIDDGR